MQTELGLRTAGAAGICFKPLSAGEFVRAENDLQQLLDGVAAESGSRLERREDKFGYTWIVVRDSELEDQVTTIHAVGQGLEEQRSSGSVSGGGGASGGCTSTYCRPRATGGCGSPPSSPASPSW